MCGYLRGQKTCICLVLFSSSFLSYSQELLNEAVSTAPIHVKGCATVTWQGGERNEKGGEERIHPVDLYDQLLRCSSDGKPWANGSLGTVTLW